jgi:hypothetical protein
MTATRTRDRSGSLRGSSTSNWRGHLDSRVLHFSVPPLLEFGDPSSNGFVVILPARRARPAQFCTLRRSQFLNFVNIRLRHRRIVFRKNNGSATITGLNVAISFGKSLISLFSKSLSLGDVGAVLIERY